MGQGGRGKELEKRINKVNLTYRKGHLAVIYNLPLPIQITALGPVPISTPTDYIGSVAPNGKAVAFDAKETQNPKSFPLKNIHDHQLNFLTYFEQTGAKSGFLIWFKQVDKDIAFWTPATFVGDFIETKTRKSIPYSKFKKEWRVNIDDYLNLLHNE